MPEGKKGRYKPQARREKLLLSVQQEFALADMRKFS